MIKKLVSTYMNILRKQSKLPFIAVDAIAIRKHTIDTFHDILLIQRKHSPYKNCMAFPGGFVELNESPPAACIRELYEETGIHGTSPMLVDVAGDKGRDPRHHVISIVYQIDIPHNSVPVGGDDAAKAIFMDVRSLLADKSILAFDHYDILHSYIQNRHKQYKLN